MPLPRRPAAVLPRLAVLGLAAAEAADPLVPGGGRRRGRARAAARGRVRRDRGRGQHGAAQLRRPDPRAAAGRHRGHRQVVSYLL